MKNRKSISILLAAILFSSSASANSFSFQNIIELIWGQTVVSESSGDGKPDPSCKNRC